MQACSCGRGCVSVQDELSAVRTILSKIAENQDKGICALETDIGILRETITSELRDLKAALSTLTRASRHSQDMREVGFIDYFILNYYRNFFHHGRVRVSAGLGNAKCTQ